MGIRRLAPLALVLVLTACSSGGGEKLGAADLPKLVLAPADLSASFERFDEGKQLLSDSQGGQRAAADRFGRVGGWRARYRRGGSSETRGPLVVESKADLFGDAEGATKELELVRREYPRGKSFDLGDGGVLITSLQPGVPRQVRTYLIFWRTGGVVASLSLNGFAGRLDEGAARRLAERQQVRIETARS